MELPEDSSSLEIQELDLIPMVAIFSMLILFLIAGTVVTNNDMAIPSHLRLAEGMKKDDISDSPKVVIADGGVQVSIFDESMDFSLFKEKYRNQPQRVRFRKSLEKMRMMMGGADKLTPFHIIADRSLSYARLYPIMNELRFDGVDSFLFISEVSD